MSFVITGVAGFVGSHLAEAVLAAKGKVLGIDCFTDYYSPADKWANLQPLLSKPDFELVVADLRTADLRPMLVGAEAVLHQAGQPGVRRSWADGFAEYSSHNIVATQRLLEAARAVGCPRLVYASSSSVYGNAVSYPTSESDLPRPHSPYGVTKLAAEHLCSLYAANWGLSTVSLRYFTVYGPRQRPDMAMRRLTDAAARGLPFDLYGSGEQVRDFTYVADVVAANLAAARADVAPGTVCNIAGGSNASMLEVIDHINQLGRVRLNIRSSDTQAGDVHRTGGSIDAATRLLGWEPRVGLRQGLAEQLAWSFTTSAADLPAEKRSRADAGLDLDRA
jgi:UDP-glucuronate 4-epimerase